MGDEERGEDCARGPRTSVGGLGPAPELGFTMQPGRPLVPSELRLEGAKPQAPGASDDGCSRDSLTLSFQVIYSVEEEEGRKRGAEAQARPDKVSGPPESPSCTLCTGLVGLSSCPHGDWVSSLSHSFLLTHDFSSQLAFAERPLDSECFRDPPSGYSFQVFLSSSSSHR